MIQLPHALPRKPAHRLDLNQPERAADFVRPSLARPDPGRPDIGAHSGKIVDVSELSDGTSELIQHVWKHNLRESLEAVVNLAERYNYIAIDTEFPGVVACPISTVDVTYRQIKCNVDMLKLLQLGISVADHRGCPPLKKSTWQFNFEFDKSTDLYCQESLDLLEANGVCFDRHRDHGINHSEFAALLISSGLVLNPRITWICFHGSYDFGYMMRMLTGQALPFTLAEFISTLNLFFPKIMDVKQLVLPYMSADVSLDTTSVALGVFRVGSHHQAGPDALTTSHVFFKLRERQYHSQDLLKTDGRRKPPALGYTWCPGVFGLKEQKSTSPSPLSKRRMFARPQSYHHRNMRRKVP